MVRGLTQNALSPVSGPLITQNQLWWQMPIILALEKWYGDQKFKVLISNRETLRPGCAILRLF